MLPSLTNGTYYTGSGGTGSQLNPGDVITSTQTIYIYATNGTCDNETSFNVTIDTTPAVDTLPDVTACVSYTLPALTNGTYYTGSGGTGSQLNPGDVITTTQTIYIYATNGTCDNETSFTITIDQIPSVENMDDVMAINEYTLPVLTNGDYFTETMGQGTQLFPGDIIDESQMIYIYADNGNCYTETSFYVNIVYQLIIPKFFTPNGDGFNDTWGITHKKLLTGKENIYIYDRYGRLMKTLKANIEFWDGKLKGIPAFSDDYWFKLKTQDGKIYTGHFTLKR